MPPNEPATPGTDRLFETGCSFCGANRWRPGSVCFVNAHHSRGFSYCGPCYEKHGGHDGMLSEYTRRKSAPSPSFVPAVGDWCEGTVAPGVNAAGQTVSGTFIRYDASQRGEAVLDLGEQAAWVTRSSLKPAPAPVVKVPAGTRFGYGVFPDDDPFEFIEEARLRDGKWHGRHAWVGEGRMVEQTDRALDCANVRILPKPSQKPVPAQAVRAVEHTYKAKGGYCPACNMSNCYAGKSPEPGQSPPDPYAGYDLNAWGISREPEPTDIENRARIAEREPNRAHLRELTRRTVADPMNLRDLAGLTGQALTDALDHNRREHAKNDDAWSLSLAPKRSARHATEREAGVKRWDAWVSVRHAREVK